MFTTSCISSFNFQCITLTWKHGCNLFHFNPYSATLFLDVALLSAALFMNVCSDNASLFCNANVLCLLMAFCSLDLNKTFPKSVICIGLHYLSDKNKNSFQTILNLCMKSEYVTLFYWCKGRIYRPTSNLNCALSAQLLTVFIKDQCIYLISCRSESFMIYIKYIP